ncbi:MAG: carboxypeptidase-like regulatory domain-containing protein [Rhodothermales bacterium]|nr:carboxypeptidase-like regulatory domain-containing protein [Rhodothermales bacterium]
MRHYLSYIFFLLLVGGIYEPATAQTTAVTLKGKITDAETGDGLPGVHVFIASSTRGTTTDVEGFYELADLPVGVLHLYVSSLGYEPQTRDILFRTPGERTIDLQLEPATIGLGEVIVEAKGDKKWKKRLERFTAQFIGETPYADSTVIVNPEVLDFSSDRGTLVATAADQLIIENRALGYRVQYFLKDFEAQINRTKYDGEPLFEEMVPTDDLERESWHANRRKAFVGSFHHFMLALLAEQVKEQGFETYGRTAMASSSQVSASPQMGNRFPVDPYSIIKPGADATEFTLDFDGFLEIIFKGEEEDKAYLSWSGRSRGSRPKFQTSWIRLEKGPTTVDYKGEVLDPYGVTFYGYYAFERVADEVPVEYRPGR